MRDLRVTRQLDELARTRRQRVVHQLAASRWWTQLPMAAVRTDPGCYPPDVASRLVAQLYAVVGGPTGWDTLTSLYDDFDGTLAELTAIGRTLSGQNAWTTPARHLEVAGRSSVSTRAASDDLRMPAEPACHQERLARSVASQSCAHGPHHGLPSLSTRWAGPS
jgi:hypothetical protein